MEFKKSKAVSSVVQASRPPFRSRHDCLGFDSHASFLASGRMSSSFSEERENSEGSRQRINEPGLAGREPWGPQFHPSGVVRPVYPVGGSDLIVGPGAGMYPTRGGYGSSGSMLLGPRDPSWFGGAGAQPGIPPGARFDPYGPPGVPGFEPSRFVRNPRRPGGGTHPDLEHFRDVSDFI